MRTNTISQTSSNLSNISQISYTSSNLSKPVKFSLRLKKIKNAEIGEIFERNIRETLILEYNFKQGNIKRHFFVRKLTFEEKEKFLLINEPKDSIIKNKKYFLFLFLIMINLSLLRKAQDKYLKKF